MNEKTLKAKIEAVLLRYHETDWDGELSPTFDEYYTSTEALDDIANIIGGFYNNNEKEG